jgi:FMN reductase
MNIIGLSGSPTAHSRSNWLLQQFLQQLQTQLGADAEVLAPVRVRDLPATALLHADFSNPEIVQALGRVAKADVVVIATPIYKAAYSGLLKTFLDLLPQDGLQHKAVVALATGGSQAHFLAVDYALKPVLSALGTREVLDTVYATDSQLAKLADGIYTASTEIEERLQRAAYQVRGKQDTHQKQNLSFTPA